MSPKPVRRPEPPHRLAEEVLSWWRPSELRRRRDALPWRERPSPWPVLVSEVMLAQTPVSRVLPRFGPFLARYEVPGRLAGASLRDVLSHFDGLGYPRRAVALRETAALITADHGGTVPDDEQALLRFPGVGSYTAKAVLAFAFDRPVMPLDTNIGRVVARALAGAPLTRAAATGAASALTTGRSHGRELARAVMDLGAELCRPRRANCELCPLGGRRPLCAWRRRGGDDPAPGSFAVSRRQPRFEGLDREGRGRLVHAATGAVIAPGELAGVAGWPREPARALRVARSLVEDGLLLETEGGYSLAR